MITGNDAVGATGLTPAGARSSADIESLCMPGLPLEWGPSPPPTDPPRVTPPLQFIRITDADSPDFTAAMAIYLAAFPAAERHPVDKIRQRVAAGQSHLLVGRQAGDIVFMALLWPLSATDFILLDYMATDAGHRGQGLATAFMAEMRARLLAEGRYLVMEVEDPTRGENTDERRRRIGLYRHLGARQLDGIRYLLPPLQGQNPTDMILMLFPEYPGGSMDGAQVEQLIRKIYQELYGRGGDDPLLIHSVGNIQARITLT